MIDFIDMRENKHNSEVEKTLKNALKMDKARVNVGRISQFGVMEMSRQRIAKTLNDAIHLECPHCEGRGKVKSVEAMALSFLRKVHAAAAKGTVAEVRGGLPLEVAYYLLNRKKRELTQIENDYEIEVTVKGKTSFLLNQLELETVKREKPHFEDVQKSDAEAEEAHKPVVPSAHATHITTDEEQKAEAAGSAEGVKKRKRRKKKKKTAGDAHQDIMAVDQTEADMDHGNGSQTEDVTEAADVTISEAVDSAADQSVKPKKRKRRRSRGKAHKDHEHSLEETPGAPVSEHVAPEAPIPVVTQPEEAAAETRPKRARTPRKKKPVTVVEEPVTSEPAVEALAPVTPKPRRRAAPKKTNEAVIIAPETEAAPPKPAARSRRKKKVDEIQ